MLSVEISLAFRTKYADSFVLFRKHELKDLLEHLLFSLAVQHFKNKHLFNVGRN